MQGRSITLSIDSRLDSVVTLGWAVNHITRRHMRLIELDAYHVELCVVEAVNNVIKHAYAEEAWHEVSVTVGLRDDRTEFRVCDRGSTMPKHVANSLGQCKR